MSNYTKSTNFATKDNLPTGDPLKIVKGTEIDTEFNNIATAISTKTDNASAAITGGSITGITDLAIADGGTGASTATAAINNLLPSQTSNANKYLQTDGTNVSWDAISINTGDITGTLPVANGGTGVTSSTGTGSVVLSNSPALVAPSLGAATASTLDVSGNVTLSGGTANTIPYLNGSKVVTTGAELYFNGTNLGVGASASYRVDLGSATSDDAAVGIRIGRGGSSTTWSLIDNVGGSGNYRQYSSGTPTFRWLTSTNGTSWSEQMRLNATGLGVGNNNPTEKLDVTGSALVSGSVTASQFYGSFNGAIGSSTAYSGAFTSLTTSSTVTINGGTANGVAYLNGSKVLTTGSVIKFDGTNFTSDRSSSTAYSGTNQATWANGIVLNNSATPATGILDSIYFSNSANMQNVFGVAQNASGYGDFVWAGYSGTYTEWMKLTSSGLTLTSNPTLSGGTANGVTYLNGSKVLTSGSALTFDGNKLQINSSAASYNPLTVQDTATSYAFTNNFVAFYNSTSAMGGIGHLSANDLSVYALGNLAFGVNNAEQMRLTSTGLGIGTSSFSEKLRVEQTAVATVAQFRKSSVANVVIGYNGTSVNYNDVDTQYWRTAAASDLMALTSTGLGIGTSSPAAKLDVLSSGLNTRINSADSNGSYIVWANNGTAKGYIGSAYHLVSGGSANNFAVRYEGALQLSYGTTVNATLDSAGNLGIGTSSPGTKLDVVGTIRSNVSGGTPIFYLNNGTTQHSIQNNSGSLAFYNDGTRGMDLTSTGLGIGTSSPSYKLDVAGVINSAQSATDSTIYVRNTATLASNRTAGLWFTNGGASVGASTRDYILQNIGTSASASDLAYTYWNGTSYLERMRIDSSGNLLVGKTSTATTAEGAMIGKDSGGCYLTLGYTGTGTVNSTAFFRGTSGSLTQVGSISTTGSATAYNTSSDYRLKNSIAPMTGALAKVAQLKPCTYKWNADGSDGEGFIAHELAEVVPQCVTGEKDAVDEEGNPKYQGIDTSFLVATLTAALQEAVAKITALEARLDAANL